jgi:hypothetical protein
MRKLSFISLSIAATALSLPLLALSAQNAPPEKDATTEPELIETSVQDLPPIQPPPPFAPDSPKPEKKEAPPPPVFVPAPPSPVPMTIAPPAPPMLRTNSIIISADGKTAQLVGRINDGIANQLKADLFKNRGVKTLVLTSEGGLLVEGVALAHIIRKNQLNTHVEFFCGSACTFALLAGKERSMAPGAIVGFHQASSMLSPLFGSNDTNDEPGNMLMRDFYADALVGAPIIDGTMATPPADMWFPDAATLSANGVVTRIAKPDEFAIAMADWKSAKAYREALALDPVWEAARTARPSDYAFAAGAGWMQAGKAKDQPSALRAAKGVLVRRLLSGASAYPDGLLEEFFRAEQMNWDMSSSDAINRDCDYGPAIIFPVSNGETKEHQDKQLAVLRKMMAIPAKKDVPDKAAQSAARADVMNFWGRMIAEQSFSTYNVANNFCREPLTYFDEMAKMTMADRAKLLRSLILVQTIGMR